MIGYKSNEGPMSMGNSISLNCALPTASRIWYAPPNTQEVKMRLRYWLTALPLLIPATAYAQITASVFGVVRDSTGAIVPQVQVTARNSSTSFSRGTLTDDSGNYLITNLPVGEYSVSFEKSGFRRAVQDGITLAVNDNARVDVALAVGQVTESVTVTAEATGVDTRSSTVGEVVDHVRIQEMPLNGRNAMGLARLVPGVAKTSVPTALSQARQGPSIAVAGGRDTQNELRFDGASNSNPLQNN